MTTTRCMAKDFDELPHQEQRRITNSGHEIGNLVQRYTAAIIIAPPPSKAVKINHGSGFLVLLGKQHFFFTAAHVIDGYDQRRIQEPELLAHLHESQFDPNERLAFMNSNIDVAVLRVSDTEAAGLGSWVYTPLNWPPRAPIAGEQVGLCGYPRVLRKQMRRDRVDFPAFALQTGVTTVSETNFKCLFEREYWIGFAREGALDERDLRGISGGPVFGFEGLYPTLIGLVTDHGPNFAVMYCARLDRVPG